jgi:hypothetical protein
MKKLQVILSMVLVCTSCCVLSQGNLNDKHLSIQLGGQRVYSGALKARLTSLSVLYEFKPTRFSEAGIQVFWPVVDRETGTTRRTIYQSTNLMVGYMAYLNHWGKADFYVRGRTGIGGASKTVLDSSAVVSVTRAAFIPIDLGVEVHYPLLSWLKVKGGVGGRITTGILSPQLSGATTALGLMINLNHLKAALTPKN